MMDAGFRGGVNGTHFERDLAEVGTNVDDSATSLRNHDACGSLTCKEHTLERRGHGSVIFFLGDVEGERGSRPAGIVYENVDPAKCIFGFIHQSLELRNVGDISKNDQGFATKRLDFSLNFANLF